MIEDEIAVKVFPNTPQCYESWSRESEIYETPELEHKYILSFRWASIAEWKRFYLYGIFSVRGDQGFIQDFHPGGIKVLSVIFLLGGIEVLYKIFLSRANRSFIQDFFTRGEGKIAKKVWCISAPPHIKP